VAGIIDLGIRLQLLLVKRKVYITGAIDKINSHISTPNVPSHERVTRKYFKIIIQT